MNLKCVAKITIFYKYLCLFADALAVLLGYYSGEALLNGRELALGYMGSHTVLFLALIFATYIIFYIANIIKSSCFNHKLTNS